MKFARWSLHARLTLWSALIVGATILVAGLCTATFLAEEQIENVDRALRQDARHFFKQFKSHGRRLAWINPEELEEVLPFRSHPARFLKITGPSGEVLFQSPRQDEVFRSASVQPQFRTFSGRRIRLLTFRNSGLTLRLGHDLGAVEDLIRELLRAYLIALPPVLAGVAFGGWWLARQALRPVHRITAVAERITARELGLRIEVPPSDDEISRLGSVLNRTFDRLDTSFRQAMRFSADASHELKTPLTILRSGLEDLLRSPQRSPEDSRALATLLEQARELSAITETLLLLSRADAGRLHLDLRSANLSELLQACLEDARIMAEGRELVFAVDLPAEVPALVDRGRLTQIVLNLLGNAIKYNQQGGIIRVSVESSASGVTLRIANTGPGIRKEQAERIFERFHRTDHTGEIPGHGLGLSLARELAIAHGGDLLLSRHDETWTEFSLVLTAPR